MMYPNIHAQHKSLSYHHILTPSVARLSHLNSSAELVLLQGFPNKEGSDLLVAFYVQMADSSGNVAFLPKAILLQILRSNKKNVAAAIGKELCEFTPYVAEDAERGGNESLTRQMENHRLELLLFLAFVSTALLVLLTTASVSHFRYCKCTLQ